MHRGSVDRAMNRSTGNDEPITGQTPFITWDVIVTMSARSLSLETESLTPLHWGAIAMALVSAAVHLIIAIVDLPLTSAFGIGFLIATAGFLGGVLLVLFDVRRRLVYLIGIPFTAGQIVMWALLNEPTLATLEVIEAIDKLAQVGLIVALVVLLRRD